MNIVLLLFYQLSVSFLLQGMEEEFSNYLPLQSANAITQPSENFFLRSLTKSPSKALKLAIKTHKDYRSVMKDLSIGRVVSVKEQAEYISSFEQECPLFFSQASITEQKWHNSMYKKSLDEHRALFHKRFVEIAHSILERKAQKNEDQTFSYISYSLGLEDVRVLYKTLTDFPSLKLKITLISHDYELLADYFRSFATAKCDNKLSKITESQINRIVSIIYKRFTSFYEDYKKEKSHFYKTEFEQQLEEYVLNNKISFKFLSKGDTYNIDQNLIRKKIDAVLNKDFYEPYFKIKQNIQFLRESFPLASIEHTFYSTNEEYVKEIGNSPDMISVSSFWGCKTPREHNGFKHYAALVHHYLEKNPHIGNLAFIPIKSPSWFKTHSELITVVDESNQNKDNVEEMECSFDGNSPKKRCLIVRQPQTVGHFWHWLYKQYSYFDRG